MAAPQKISKENMAMIMVVVIVVLVGGIFLWRENQATQGARKVNHNDKRYDEGSLHYVHDELIRYKRSHRFTSGFKTAWSLHATQKGELLVSGESGFKIFNLKGDVLNTVETNGLVRFITEGKDGKIYACIKNRIEVFDAKGNPSGTIKNDKFGNLNALALAKDYFFVADRTQRKILKCDYEGKILMSLGHGDKTNGLVIPGPHMDLAWGPDGFVYVTNPGRHQINSYNETGELKGVFGRPSFKHEGFCGCCNPVSMTILPDGQVVTTEKGIARVKLMSIDGSLKGIVAPPVDFKANKHAYIVDVSADAKGAIFLLENGTNEVYIYHKREA